MTGSAGQRRVPARFFDRFQVRYFPLHERRTFADILDTVDEAIRQTYELIAKLRRIKAGRVRVKDVRLDEAMGRA